MGISTLVDLNIAMRNNQRNLANSETIFMNFCGLGVLNKAIEKYTFVVNAKEKNPELFFYQSQWLTAAND